MINNSNTKGGGGHGGDKNKDFFKLKKHAEKDKWGKVESWIWSFISREIEEGKSNIQYKTVYILNWLLFFVHSHSSVFWGIAAYLLMIWRVLCGIWDLSVSTTACPLPILSMHKHRGGCVNGQQMLLSQWCVHLCEASLLLD